MKLDEVIEISLKSWKGDYLHRPDSAQEVTTWHTGIGNKWTLEPIEGGKHKLKSWKGDYLHRPDTAQGVTTWNTGVGNEWTIEAIDGGKVKLKSWKGDYLHRPDTAQGVTTWHTGVGNEWELEILSPPKVAKVVIANINYDGAVRHTESDEYVEITNEGNAAADISGWKIDSDFRGHSFIFPQGTTLAPAQTIRVYTNEIHAETGGFSFGSKVTVWQNGKGHGRLFDDKGNVVSEFIYDVTKK